MCHKCERHGWGTLWRAEYSVLKAANEQMLLTWRILTSKTRILADILLYHLLYSKHLSVWDLGELGLSAKEQTKWKQTDRTIKHVQEPDLFPQTLLPNVRFIEFCLWILTRNLCFFSILSGLKIGSRQFLMWTTSLFRVSQSRAMSVELGHLFIYQDC